jgi:glycogen synthase
MCTPVFQREVINHIVPKAPDLIHCNDWMTALIPCDGEAARN